MVTGELDLATAPMLEYRLGQLQAENRAVRVDLSELEFMDSTGVHLFLRAAEHARRTGWQLDVQRDLLSQVRRLFRLTGVEDFILAGDRDLVFRC
jgi:anti-anti-sigma factor